MQSNPVSIFCIIATEFCERFSFCGLRTILSLYLRNVLCLHENTATVVYHVFIMLCYTMPLVGAVLADNYLGRYSVILYFSIVYLVGSILTCCAAIPPLKLSPMWFSMVGLSLIAAGTGGIKPCVAAFGGDQVFFLGGDIVVQTYGDCITAWFCSFHQRRTCLFRLPQENAKLQRFFSVFYCTVNLGGCVGMVVTPLLRKSVTCFGDDTCYALGFGFPALLMVLSILIFVAGKPWYRIKLPKNNVTIQFISCAWYALRKRLRTDAPQPHWLDHATERYGRKLVADMKIVCGIMYLYLPVPLFWSLFDQQGSRWTFQASRLRGEIAGVALMPDQLQVMNPAMVLLMIPVCPGGVWPVFPNLPPLEKMFVGGLMASMAFVAAGILQIAIERSTLQAPGRNEAGLALLNTLKCPVVVKFGGYGAETVEEHGTAVLYPLPANMEMQVTAKCSIVCAGRNMSSSEVTEKLGLIERLFLPILISQNSDDAISLHYMDPNSFTKSLTGKAKMKVVYIGEADATKNVSISVDSGKRLKDVFYTSDSSVDHVGESAYMCLTPGRFSWSAISTDGDVDGRGSGFVHTGGVYVLCARQRRGRLDTVALHAPNPPNELHLGWIAPQYLLLSVAEIMFAVSGLEFSFTQAPKSMKTITIAAWYVSVAFGNLLVILVTQSKIFESQATEFFVYAGLLACGMLAFLRLSRGYEAPAPATDGSSSEAGPLLRHKARVVSMRSLVPTTSVASFANQPSSSSDQGRTAAPRGQHGDDFSSDLGY